MSQIVDIDAREVLDSRGYPTVSASVRLECGSEGYAMVPSGASTGRHEAHELRDGDESRYGGRGVLRAVENIKRELFPLLSGIDACEQNRIDSLMSDLDGSENKSHLGANSILAVSLAVSRAAAVSCGLPLYRYLGGASSCILPMPYFNVLNGGVHADNSLSFQEFMVLPLSAPSFSEALRYGVEVLLSLRSLLRSRSLSVNVGDEGGFAPALSTNAEALDLLGEAIVGAGFKLGVDIGLALDCAASEFLSDGVYDIAGEGLRLDSSGMIDYLSSLVDAYGVVSIEDGLGEDDWEGWSALTSRLGDRVQLVGDDLFVTREGRLSDGISRGAGNSILVKPNQIGTLSETLSVIGLARSHGWGAIISHRSGETEDSFIADISVACGSGQIKSGAPVRGERTAKYNRLLRIEEELGSEARFVGGKVLSRSF